RRYGDDAPIAVVPGTSSEPRVRGKGVIRRFKSCPRNHENAVKSRTWRRFSFFVAVHAAKERKEDREPVERVSSRASIFRTASADCLPSRRRLKARCSVD